MLLGSRFFTVRFLHLKDMGRQKQFSVRESSRKCVKKSTNEISSSSKRKKSVEENFITQCRPRSLYDLVKSLNPEQKSDICSVGFGGLLNLDTPHISVDLLRPFVHKFNGVSRLLTINDKFSFVVTADDICDVFQLPRVVGKEVIECKSKDFKDLDIVKRWGKDHQINSNTSMSDLKEKLLSFVEGGEDFVRLFVLFSLNSFLCPTANRLMRFKAIKSVIDVKYISEFDWCSYVLKKLCKAVVKSNNNDVLVKNCSGCLFVLPILYFHRLKWQGIAEPSTLPLVQHWTNIRIKKRFKEEISSGGLGNGVWEEEGLFPISKGSSIEDIKYKLPDDQPIVADLEKTSKDPRQNKRARPATPTKVSSIFDTCDGEATAALVPESQACPPSSVLEDVKRELATARNKEKELEATISQLKAENKKNEQELMMNARNKEKELEATISGLRHKNKVFSDQCASYESLVEDLKVENKKTKEELMNADKKYYAGARAAGYAEGLKEGKADRLKFFHHLTDTSIRYFNHGFDSCLKQAEEHGFCGQLNKDSALEDAPAIKGWESSHQPH